MPDGRSAEYAVWRSCERLGIRPPRVRDRWEDNDLDTQALIIAFNQIREDENAKLENQRLLASVGSRAFS